MAGFAWRHQAITWTNIDNSSARYNYINIRTISQEIYRSSITNINLNITCLKFLSDLPGANESRPVAITDRYMIKSFLHQSFHKTAFSKYYTAQLSMWFTNKAKTRVMQDMTWNSPGNLATPEWHWTTGARTLTVRYGKYESCQCLS